VASSIKIEAAGPLEGTIMTPLLPFVLAAALAAAAPEGPETVVFVCEHGSAKSVVAATHFNRIAAERGLNLRAISRGTAPDAELAPAAVKGLLGDGLSPKGSVPQQLEQKDLDLAARVVTFCEIPADLTARVPVERWEVPPVSSDYAASRDAMLAHIEQLLAVLGTNE
jgi:arsenate reductase